MVSHRSKIKYPRRKNGRIRFFALCLILFAGLVAYRLFHITFFEHADYVKAAQLQQNNTGALLAGRGSIYALDQTSGQLKLFAAVQKAKAVRRHYPQGTTASHILGFVGYKGSDRVGQYGIEAYYDDVLNGTA